MKEYPKALYLKNGRMIVVKDKEEEDLMLKGDKDESGKDNSKGTPKKSK